MKDVVDPSKVKIAGPGLGTAVRAKIPQSFTVDTSKAGAAPLEVVVAGPRGENQSAPSGCAHLHWGGDALGSWPCSQGWSCHLMTFPLPLASRQEPIQCPRVRSPCVSALQVTVL